MKKSRTFIQFVQSHVWEFSLVFLCLIMLISHTLYVLKTHQFPQGGLDEPVYLESALSMHDLLKDSVIGNWPDILRVTVNRQPFYPLFIAVAVFISGTENLYKTGLWINIIFYSITIVSIYTLGRRFLSKRSSFLASYIFAFYGFPLFYLHFTYSETAVTAFISAAAAALAWSEGFTNIGWVIKFSILFACSALVRWVAPLFIVGPFFAALTTGLMEQRRHLVPYGKKLLKCAGICIVFGLLPALLLHYLPQREYLFGYVFSNTSNSGKWAEQYLGIPSIQSVFSARSVMFYLNIFSQQGIYFWLLFVAGFLVSLRFFRRYMYLLSGFIVPYAIFTFGSAWKGDRFILPIYPFMALISAVIFDHISSSFLRRLFIALTLIVGFLNLLGASWGIGPLGQQGLKDIVLPEYIHHPRRIYLTTMVWPPRKNEANIDVIDASIRNDWRTAGKVPVIALGFFLPQMENGLGEVWGREKRGTASLVFLYNLHKSDEDVFFDHIMKADYIFMKTGSVSGGSADDTPPEADDGYYFARMLQKKYFTRGMRLPEGYIKVDDVHIPVDKSTMTIFKKTKNVTKIEWRTYLSVKNIE